MIAAIKDDTAKSQAKEAERLNLIEFDGEAPEDGEDAEEEDENHGEGPILEDGEEEVPETDTVAEDVD